MSEYQVPGNLPAPVGPHGYHEAPGYIEVGEDNDSATALVWHYLRVLRRQAWKIIGFVFAVVAAALLYSLQLTPLYQADAVLELESLNQVVRIGSEMTGYNYRDESKVIETQLRLINSPDIVASVVRDLGLHRSPLFGYDGKGEPRIPERLPGLSASMVPGTYLLRISYLSPNPELARDIANSVAKAYIEQGYESRYQNAKDLQNWLDKQLEDLRARSELAQQRLLGYEREHNIVRSEGRTDLVAEELQQLQSDLIAIQSERVQKEVAYRGVESGSLDDLLVSAQSGPIASLVGRREEMDAQLREASLHYGPNHPVRQKLVQQLADIDSQLDRTRERVLEMMAAEYREVVLQEEAIRERYLEKKEAVDRLASLAVEYGTLRREAETTTALYEQLLRTVNEVGLQSSIRSTNLRIATPAQTPGQPVYPDIPGNLLLALLCSLAIGVTAAILVDYLDRTVRNTEQVEQWLRVPVLANLPRLSGNKRPHTYLLPASSNNGSLAQEVPQEAHALVEGFTMLRTSLLLSAQAGNLRLILVASAVPAEGKSTVAAGLAMALAQQVSKGKRVLLVDGDLRRPTVHGTFGLDNQVGLSSVLEERCSVADAVQNVDSLPSFCVMPRGPATAQPNELLAANMGRVIEELRQEFEYVVIDSAPLLASADSMILTSLVDGVLLVARAGGTSRDMVGAAFRQVKRVRGNVIGLVLNQVRQADQDSYHYYYSYYHRSEE